MADKYIDFISGGFGKKLAKQLGLPQPVKLRRYEPNAPLVPGPVHVVSPDGAPLETLISAMGATAKSTLREGEKWGAVVVDLTGIAHPRDLSELVLALGGTLRGLATCGRIVTISRTPAGDVNQQAARAAVEGFLRSLAKELRAGATANGIMIADGVAIDSISVAGALKFLLSGRSAFVDGQFIRVSGEGSADPGRSLEGKVAAVTGAARGIGAEIARVLAREGATVVAIDVPQAGEGLAKTANAVRGTALPLDVTAPDAADQIYAHASERHGGLDIVIHNAGILRDKLLANMKPDKWDDLIAVNITAPLTMNERFVELAREGKLGESPRFISLASTSGIAGNRGQTNYGAAKAGLIGMTEALAPTLAEIGGTVNAVAPGFIETDMTASIPTVSRQIFRRTSSLQQGGLPVDVAETIAFLVSPAAGGINGTTVRVCGQNLVGR
ncbi:3-oxoacyl-[acyl-carrier protein] reductase [Ruaniaceae bacterium KH17]|nr:3-oxoacyl-[acyl-carrier protein] reductase [Ruaniaceae bacterium KH17]